jgi:hypothetical protein
MKIFGLIISILILCVFISGCTENKSDKIIPIIKEPIESVPMYGCPGCPHSFMDFAQDMCPRFGSGYTVEDGVNRISCAEILNQTNVSIVTEQEGE